MKKLDEAAGGTAGNEEEEDKGQKFSQAQLLVKLADGVEFFHDGDIPYATVQVEGHRETHPLDGRGFRQWLSRQYWRSFNKAIGSQAMQDALGVLSGRATFDGPQKSVFVRIAGHGDALYLDLCDDRWQAVEVTAEGWRVVSDPPVRFIRRRGMRPLPVPVQGGTIKELRPLINAGQDADWILMVAWLVGAFRPDRPKTVLSINGEQGSAKSTTSRMLRGLIDPNEADLRSAPRDERDLMIAATNAWVVAFDNLSSIPPMLSDSLCRLSTGGGFATRELYSDAEEKLFSAIRPVLFNGIEELATRPDLLERSVVVNLPAIPEENRMSEEELWRRYEQVRPRVLGALLNAVSAALRNLPSVSLTRRPRMADFAEWVTAAEPALPWEPGTFMRVYTGNRDEANELAVETSAIGPAVLGLMHSHASWEGTAKELLAELDTDRHSDRRTRDRQDWPKTPKAVSNALRRLAPTLRRLGVETHFDRRPGGNRSRVITLEQVGEAPSPPSPTPPVPDLEFWMLDPPDQTTRETG